MKPLIVIGMHRSGTSAVVRVMQRLGVFVGADLQDDNESRTFIGCNEYVFRRAEASWDAPEPVIDLIRDANAVAALAGDVHAHLRGGAATAYLGPRQTWRDLRTCAWGWKDPRNSFTLPIWLRLWPDARVLHVTRNPVDVAASLRVRHRKVVSHYRRVHGVTPPAPVFYLGRVPFTHRPATLEGGVGIWRAYLSRANSLRATLTNPWLDLRYEDLYLNPDLTISRLARFCGVAGSSQAIEHARGALRSEPAFRFSEDSELKAFAKRLTGASLFGYEKELEARISG